jgi:hypothetical protein
MSKCALLTAVYLASSLAKLQMLVSLCYGTPDLHLVCFVLLQASPLMRSLLEQRRAVVWCCCQQQCMTMTQRQQGSISG